VFVSKHYPEIRYTILPDGALGSQAGGTTFRNEIRYQQSNSVSVEDGDGSPPTDIHELIHLINGCSGALQGATDHIWHGALMNAVQVRLGWPQQSTRSHTTEELKRLLDGIEALPAGSQNEAYRFRTAILSDQLELFYFEHGENAIARLYRSTTNPHPIRKPSQTMVNAWRTEAEANKVEALLEVLKQEFKFTFDKRTRAACGFP
jgi:hypothetical protein